MNFLKNYPKLRQFLVKNRFVFLILTSILTGFIIGILIKQTTEATISEETKLWIYLPGNLFTRAMSLLILPVIFVGTVTATSSLSAKENLHITLICFIICIVTLLTASFVGFLSTLIYFYVVKLTIFQPNLPISSKLLNRMLIRMEEEIGVEMEMTDKPAKTAYDIVGDLLNNLIPKNIFKSLISQEITVYHNKSSESREIVYIEGTNLLGILTFAILVGLSASMNHKVSHAVREFFKALNEIILNILRWVVFLAPIGILSLIVEAVLNIKDLNESFKSIILFTAFCSVALLFYSVILLSLFTFILIRENPFKYFGLFLEPILITFASASATVAIPNLIECCEKKCKMSKKISKFTISFFITLHSDGSALFMTSACMFLAFYSNHVLTSSDYLTIVIMSTLMCLCLPSVPSASLLTISLILNSLGIDSKCIAILYTVEWLLDRIRTTVNGYSCALCSIITYKLIIRNKIVDSTSILDTATTVNENTAEPVLVDNQKNNNKQKLDELFIVNQ